MDILKQAYLAVDVETTGLSAGEDEIIEIGAVKLIRGEIKEVFREFVRPLGTVPQKITELTGITEEMLEGAEPLEAVFPRFLDFAGELPLLGHNLPFDYSFLKAACKKQKLSFERKGTDTLRLARIFHPSMEKKTLAAMAAAYGIDPGREHRAADDAATCAELYIKMAEAFGSDPEKQELFLPQPIKANIRKSEPATGKQKKYLLDLLKYHKIEGVSVETLTKSRASAMIDYLRSGHPEKVKL